MSEYFLGPKSSGGRARTGLDLSNYETKADLKNTRGINTWKFVKTVDLTSLKTKLDTENLKNVPSGLSSLKSKVDKLDNGKLETTPVDSVN